MSDFGALEYGCGCIVEWVEADGLAGPLVTQPCEAHKGNTRGGWIENVSAVAAGAEPGNDRER